LPIDIADPRALIKVSRTSKSAGATAAPKRSTATELVTALRLTDRDRIDGRRILVYDDVCITGSQLDADAGLLIDEGGAVYVEGVAQARVHDFRGSGPHELAF